MLPQLLLALFAVAAFANVVVPVVAVTGVVTAIGSKVVIAFVVTVAVDVVVVMLLMLCY